MSRLLENEIAITPRPMNDKQLMVLYEIKHRLTWQKMLKPIAWRLMERKIENRYFYNTQEVAWIFEFLGQPIIFRQVK